MDNNYIKIKIFISVDIDNYQDKSDLIISVRLILLLT